MVHWSNLTLLFWRGLRIHRQLHCHTPKYFHNQRDGMHDHPLRAHGHPVRAHASSFLECLASSPISAAWPQVWVKIANFVQPHLTLRWSIHCERDQLGTRMSAGLDRSLGTIPLPFSTCRERHALRQKWAMHAQSRSELVVSDYNITPRMTRKHTVMSPSIHVVMTKSAIRCQRKAKPPI